MILAAVPVAVAAKESALLEVVGVTYFVAELWFRGLLIREYKYLKKEAERVKQ